MLSYQRVGFRQLHASYSSKGLALAHLRRLYEAFEVSTGAQCQVHLVGVSFAKEAYLGTPISSSQFISFHYSRRLVHPSQKVAKCRKAETNKT